MSCGPSAWTVTRTRKGWVRQSGPRATAISTQGGRARHGGRRRETTTSTQGGEVGQGGVGWAGQDRRRRAIVTSTQGGLVGLGGGVAAAAAAAARGFDVRNVHRRDLLVFLRIAADGCLRVAAPPTVSPAREVRSVCRALQSSPPGQQYHRRGQRHP